MNDPTIAPSPIPSEPGFFRLAFEYLSGPNLLARAIILVVLTLALKVPLGLVGGVIEDRQTHEAEATKRVTEAWGSAQIFAGPMIVVPYRRVAEGRELERRQLTLLPEKLSIDGHVRPEQRHRGLFAVTVYSAALDVVAEFRTKALLDLSADTHRINWVGARLDLGLTDAKTIEVAAVEVEGQKIEWLPSALANTSLAAVQASLRSVSLEGRETVTVRFRITFGGSGSLAFVPLGQRTDITIASPWRSPSFIGHHLPLKQIVDNDGFRASWSTSHLGRRYGQLWDSASSSDPSSSIVTDSAFGFALHTPIDTYRQTDQAIKYAAMFIGLTFAACLLFEMATGTRPHVAQYGLIGLSLCVFYLLLLSASEQIGFAPAYLASAAAVVVQATIYNWALYRRRGPALAFGAILTGLYAGLYALLRLEDVALLAGSMLLFAVLSLAMWFTRNLHRTQPA